MEKEIEFDWGKMKKSRDRYIGRLNGIYEDGLDKLKVCALQRLINCYRSFSHLFSRATSVYFYFY